MVQADYVVPTSPREDRARRSRALAPGIARACHGGCAIASVETAIVRLVRCGAEPRQRVCEGRRKSHSCARHCRPRRRRPACESSKRTGPCKRNGSIGTGPLIEDIFYLHWVSYHLDVVDRQDHKHQGQV